MPSTDSGNLIRSNDHYFLRCVVILILCAFLVSTTNAADPVLTLDYYASTCPSLLHLVRKEMECAVLSYPRSAALMLRLHFHDCFVQGCDGSVLLDDTVSLKGEKTASPNIGSLIGFRLVDRIKNLVESDCPGIVSCADILTIAARDAVVLVGGPYWDVPLGRKDSKTAGYDLANQNLPLADDNIFTIISKFLYQGLSVTDMVALSGAHTIGMARCENYRSRIYGGDYGATAEIAPVSDEHLNSLKATCPANGPSGGGGDDDGEGETNIAAMDYVTPELFDNSFYHLLLRGDGLLNSDQELYSGSFLGTIETKKLVKRYAADAVDFFEQFAESMVKLGNITNSDSFATGEVRKSCRYVNI